MVRHLSFGDLAAVGGGKNMAAISCFMRPPGVVTIGSAKHARVARCSTSVRARVPDYTVYLVTDRQLSRGRAMDKVVEAAITGGVSVVQLREKNASTREMMQIGRELMAITKRREVPLLVNDRVDVALALDADGVHVGQDDMEAKTVRKLIGNKKLLGVSAGTVDEAIAAEQDGADYIGVGAVFGTASKADAGDAIGVDELARIVKSVRIPVVAIGGVNSKNVAQCARAGAKGAAVISAVVSADDPALAASQLRAEFTLADVK